MSLNAIFGLVIRRRDSAALMNRLAWYGLPLVTLFVPAMSVILTMMPFEK